MKKQFNLVCLFLIVGISGCTAATPPTVIKKTPQHSAPVKAVPAAVVKPKAVPVELSENLLYHLLVGEIATQRGEFKEAVKSYKEATILSNNIEVAKRATKIAVYDGSDDALSIAKQWVTLDPKDAEAQKTVAILYFRVGDTANALVHMKRLLSFSDIKKVDGYLFIANLLSQEKDVQSTISLMSDLVDSTGSTAQGNFALATLAVVAKRLRVAQERAEKVLTMTPGDLRAQNLFGRILIGSEQKPQALEYFQTIYDAGNADLKMKNTLARLFVDVKRYGDAKSVFQNMLALEPRNNETVYALALLAMQTESFDTAEQYLKVLDTAKFKVNEVRFYLGQISDAKEQFDDAFQWYQKIRLGKHYFDAQVRMVDILSSQGKIKQARVLIRSIRVQFPDLSVKLYLLEAELVEQVKDFNESMTIYDTALKTHPKDEDLLYNRALLGEEMGRMDILERDLRAIIAFNPKSANALNALGYTLVEKTPRVDEGLKMIQQALRLKPNDPAILDSLGWAQYKLGDLDQAELHLRKAFDVLTDGEVAAHLSEVLYRRGKKQEAKKIWSDAMTKNPESEHLLAIKDLFND
jgi:tetratricopeptide (TPR) repeat protein